MKHWTLLILLFASLLAAPAQPAERPRVGLVLGGGGALGAAHVGVLKALESADIPIDCIAGTSIGAVVGGLYASGWTAQQLDSLFCSQEWLDLLTDRDSRYSEQLYNIDADGMLYIMGIPIMRLKGKDKAITFDLTRLGALRGDSISARLDQLTGHRGSIDFDRLPVPFRCVSFDVLTLSEVVHRQGSLPDAMRASMSLPGVFKPMKTDTQLLIDGGVADNLPVDVVREMGADVVIAVDLSRKNLGQGNGDADICLRPNLKEFDIASFGRRQVRQMIRIGYVETLARLSQLKRVANP
ncbi:MAG: patatin-like phospholipase family protein [Bacteroidaceae bacterium]|nr:patatin-like phospholipase family protein [Bacteroidaceae bacterium]